MVIKETRVKAIRYYFLVTRLTKITLIYQVLSSPKLILRCALARTRAHTHPMTIYAHYFQVKLLKNTPQWKLKEVTWFL